jgi:cytochrome P450
MFSQRKLNDNMERVFLKVGETLIGILASKTNKQEIDVQDLYFRFTMDSFCEIAFGATPNSLQEASTPAFSSAFDRICERIFSRRLEPGPLFRLKKLLGSADERQMVADHKTVDAFILPICREALKAGKEGVEGVKGNGEAMSLLVALARAEGRELDAHWVRDQCMSFLLAGRDTTASLLTSLTQLLALHPRVEAKLRGEVEEVLQSRTPSHDTVKGLTYMECCMHEALRLYPPAPLNIRKAIKDDVLPNGIRVPAGNGLVVALSLPIDLCFPATPCLFTTTHSLGTECVFMPWVMARNPKHFPDAEVLSFVFCSGLQSVNVLLGCPWRSDICVIIVIHAAYV